MRRPTTLSGPDATIRREESVDRAGRLTQGGANGSQVARFRGYPQAVRTDQGPEFTSRAFMVWAQAKGVRHLLNQPGKPTQNAYIESFNGKFRDECLNAHWFQSLKQARDEIARWRTDYKEVRPHSSCGRMPPAKFAAQHRKTAGGTVPAPLQTQE